MTTCRSKYDDISCLCPKYVINVVVDWTYKAQIRV